MHASWRVSASSGTSAPLAVYLGGLNVKSLLYTNKSTSRFYLDSATVHQVLIEPL